MNNYDQQAADFLEKTGTTFHCEYLKYDTHFIGETEERDIYKICLKKGRKRYTFCFGDSIKNSTSYPKTFPTAYDILACITKYDPGEFDDFCGEFGYNEDSRTAEKIYKAVKKEWQNIERLFSENEIEMLREIQ